MQGDSPDYKALYHEQQRLLQAAEAERDEATARLRKTTLVELLHGSHIHCTMQFTVQTNLKLCTSGTPANAERKLRPDHIRYWDDFGSQQAAVWSQLMSLRWTQERHFRSTNQIEGLGDSTKRRKHGSEQDLHTFQRMAVEEHIALAVQHLYEDPVSRRRFRLKGTIEFENHSNTLDPGEASVEDVEYMSLSTAPRRSPRLQALRASPEDTRAAEGSRVGARTPRPRADQFCVYSFAGESENTQIRIPAFIVEYKAPHKLSLGCIHLGLTDMDLDQVVEVREEENVAARCRRLVAAVITQAFSYMVAAGLEYGCVCTGEAYIFLRILDDARTVYYYLSVPKDDVGPETGWTPTTDEGNRLHLTALGQMLAFTLTALGVQPRSERWKKAAAEQLQKWQISYMSLVGNIPTPERLTNEYRPSRRVDNYTRQSPIRLRRQRPTAAPSCDDVDDPISSDTGSEPDTPGPQGRQTALRHPAGPSQQPGSSSVQPLETERSGSRGGQGTQQQYCTQDCLRGLVTGGPLDRSCPNVHFHGSQKHEIDKPAFIRLAHQQLTESLDTDVECLRVHGARGVLFRIRLSLYGYVVAAKAAPAEFRSYLMHEATVYDRLSAIQGTHVPVHLGNIDLAFPFYYDGIAELTHMMLLSFGGTCIALCANASNIVRIEEEAVRSLRAVHELDVLQQDAEPRNLLWDAAVGRVYLIDFERAEVRPQRTALAALSPNRETKRVAAATEKSSTDVARDFDVEARFMRRGIHRLPAWLTRQTQANLVTSYGSATTRYPDTTLRNDNFR